MNENLNNELAKLLRFIRCCSVSFVVLMVIVMIVGVIWCLIDMYCVH